MGGAQGLFSAWERKDPSTGCSPIQLKPRLHT